MSAMILAGEPAEREGEMSTRETIAYDDERADEDRPVRFHVFHELMDGGVYVALRGEFADDWEAGPNGVTVRLPAPVLEALQGVKERGPFKMASEEDLRRRFPGCTFIGEAGDSQGSGREGG